MVRNLFDGWRIAARETPPAALITAVLDESGYRKELEAERTVEAESRLENLEELVNAAREYERVEPEPTLDGFLQEQALYSEADRLAAGSEGGRVTLMTLHNAKGLEYGHVFVVGMEEGTFPHSRSLDEQNLEEERRLCYVGITRAMRSLTLTHARLRSSWGGDREYQMPSRFLSEIPEEFLAGTVPGGSSTGDLPGRGALSARRAGTMGTKRPGKTGGETSAEAMYRAGEKVRHAKFGVGEVVEATAGKVVVRFEAEAGERILVPELAPLTRVDN